MKLFQKTLMVLVTTLVIGAAFAAAEAAVPVVNKQVLEAASSNSAGATISYLPKN